MTKTQVDHSAGRPTVTMLAPALCAMLVATVPMAAHSQTLNNNAVPLAKLPAVVESAVQSAVPTLNELPTAIQPVLPDAVLTLPGILDNSIPDIELTPDIANTVRSTLGAATAATIGLGRLVAPGNADSSVVVARIGSAVRADLTSLTADFDGDGLINFEIAPAIVDMTATADQLGGDTLLSLVGQHVTMSTGTVDQVLDSVINVEGILPATTFEISDGTVVLGTVGTSVTAVPTGLLPATGGSTSGDPSAGAALVPNAANGANGPEISQTAEETDPTVTGCPEQECGPDDPQPEPGPIPNLPEDYSDHLRPALADFDFDGDPRDLLDVSIMLPLRGREREGDLFSNYGNEEIW